MPLSLLLTQQFTLLTKGVRQLAAWEGLTDTFALVVRRLRSAYLVKWFGTGLPVEGIDLRVSIANLDELRGRYLQVSSGNRGAGSGGPNLTEPLLGMGGTVAGALAFPLNGMVVAVIAGSLLRKWWQSLIAGLLWITGGGLLTAVLLLGAPLVTLVLVASAFGGQAADTYDLLGALAAMALPLQRLWAQLSGREPVRNPLLRQLMTFGDRLAALLAQVLGAVAVAVTRIGPQIRPAVDAASATISAVGQLVEAIQLVVANLLEALDLMLSGPRSVPAILNSVTGAVGALIGRLATLVRGALSELVAIALARVGPTLRTIVGWVTDAARFVKAVILDQTVVRWLLALRGLADVFGRWSRRTASPSAPAPPPPSPSPPSPWVTSFPLPASVRAFRRALTLTPTLPLPAVSTPPFVGPENIEPIAGAMRQGFLSAPPDPFALDPRQRDALRRYRRPPSVLGGLRAEVDARRREATSTGRAFALADVYAGIRPYIARSIGLLAPAQAATVLPRIEGLLDRLDVELRRREPAHPTRDLPEPTDVRPVVGRLVVRTGVPDTEGQYRRFVETLRRELDARPYSVPALAGGGRGR